MSAENPSVIRFGVFEVDMAARTLRKRGVRVKLQDQPFRLLTALLEKPGQIVTREEIKEKLWPDGTFVDFDKSLNTAAQKVREALGDSASSPRFLETVPRVGYRFLAPLEVAGDPHGSVPTATRPGERTFWYVLLGISLFLTGGLFLYWPASQGASDDSKAFSGLKVTPLTSLSGMELEPSFSPDGEEVAFAWNGPNGANFDIYTQLVAGGNPYALTSHPAVDRFPAWSPNGRQIAFLRFRDGLGGQVAELVLAPAPRVSGPERTLGQVNVDPSHFATRLGLAPAWSPEGDTLSVVSRLQPDEPYGIFLVSVASGDQERLTKAPQARVVDYSPHFSPDGQSVAFVRTRAQWAADIYIVDRAGGRPDRIAEVGEWIDGLTWTPDGSEILYSASGSSGPELYRVAVFGGPSSTDYRSGARVGETCRQPRSGESSYLANHPGL